MKNGQENWRNLIKQTGSGEAARKVLADELRKLADIVEAPSMPDVFGFDFPATDWEKDILPMGDWSITLSYPWPG